MSKIESVDEYIKKAPKEIAEKLSEIRSVIKKTVPDAEEKISYGMPYYSYHGRLAYFAYFKNHISFYAMNGALLEYQKEVEKYKTGRATLQFDLDKKIPLGLLRKLVQFTKLKNSGK